MENNAASPNQCGTPSLTSDPKLGPLADNGGSTYTMALHPTSPAINAGDNDTCETTDQIGIARPQGAFCDIGAFEVEYAENISPTVLSITRKNTSPTSAGSVDFTVTFSEPVNGVNTTSPFSDFAITTKLASLAPPLKWFSGSGSAYTVTVTTGSGSGTIRLDVPNAATIIDLAGNPVGGLPFTRGETYTS